MEIGDLVKIKEEHIDSEYIQAIAWDSYWTGRPTPPSEEQWIGLVMGYLIDDNGYPIEDMIYIQWTWSGRTVLEYTEHLEVIKCNPQ